MSIKVHKECPICLSLYESYKNKKTCSLKCSYVKRGLDKTKDLVGKTFGELTVIGYVGSISSKVVWLCECSCGGRIEVNAGDLTRSDSRKTRHCGNRIHNSKDRSPHWKGKYGIPATYFRAVCASAKSRGIDFKIEYEDMAAVFNGKCALSGISIEHGENASLDRIDSSKGYVSGNIQWVHKDVNKIKTNLNQEYFIYLCKKIAEECNNEQMHM